MKCLKTMKRKCCDNLCRQGRDCPNNEPSLYQARYYNLLKDIKKLWHYLDKQFTLVEWLVILILAVLLSIGFYKGILWTIQKSMTASTFYQVMKMD
jgi:hypothetical protein